MRMIIRNELLEADIFLYTGEIRSLVWRSSGQEFMWQRNPAIWKNSAPVLFPIVGGLKDNTYFYEGTAYQMPRHGFIRTEELYWMESLDHPTSSVSMRRSSTETYNFRYKSMYPFDYSLSLYYTLQDNSLIIRHVVENIGKKDLYFSLGAHPGFNCPFHEGEKYEDYELFFEKKETVRRWNLNEHGLVSGEGDQVLVDSQVLPLRSDLFDSDALVFKDLQSRKVRLQSPLHKKSVTVSFDGFPYFGIWAKPGAPFVCLEPWQGIADSVDTTQRLEEKEGIMCLLPGQQHEATYTITVEG